MSAISDEIADGLFEAVSEIRTSLPQLVRFAELVDPKDAAIIEALEFGLSRLFDLVVALRSNPSDQAAADALKAQRAAVLADWRAALKT